MILCSVCLVAVTHSRKLKGNRAQESSQQGILALEDIPRLLLCSLTCNKDKSPAPWNSSLSRMTVDMLSGQLGRRYRGRV
ncbi:hypothetical protein GQ53DRAFT_740775 [Thozetella sp. PMI_491]|nr:hypothetical protein GQ53DRAFT_740775 [Thozetella sp. PMI_491]